MYFWIASMFYGLKYILIIYIYDFGRYKRIFKYILCGF
jgi:hypothetical protein